MSNLPLEGEYSTAMTVVFSLDPPTFRLRMSGGGEALVARDG
jgi:hypothetical protein